MKKASRPGAKKPPAKKAAAKKPAAMKKTIATKPKPRKGPSQGELFERLAAVVERLERVVEQLARTPHAQDEAIERLESMAEATAVHEDEAPELTDVRAVAKHD